MYQHILVPFDGSPTSTQGLDEAIKLAKVTGASVRLLHVVNELVYLTGFESYPAYAGDVVPLMKEAGEEILVRGKERVAAAGVEVDAQLVENWSMRLSEVIAEQALDWKADLIVIGTHGRRGMQRLLLGSDAEMVLRTAPVPVLLVRTREVKTTTQGD